MKKNVLKMFTACAAVCLTAGLVAVSGGNDAKADEPFSVEYNFEDDSYKQDDIFNLGITTEVVEGINSDVGSREFGEAVSTGNKCLKITNRASGKKWWEQNGFAYDLKKLTPGVSYDIKVDVYHENGAVADKDYTALRPFKIGTRYEGADAGNDTDHPKNYSQIGNKKGADTKTWERLEGTIKIPEGIDEGKFLFAIASLDQVYWVAGSIIGAVAGSVLPFNSEGIDFAMTALFVVIFIEQWLDKKNRIPEIIGVAAAFIGLQIFGASRFVLPSMLLIVMILFVSKKQLQKEVNPSCQ